MKGGGGVQRISDEGGSTVVGGDLLEILKIRPPSLAKDALAQCYIKLSFIAEIR